VERLRPGRKLLIATIGAAAVSYVACGGDDTAPQADAGGKAGASVVTDAGASGSQGMAGSPQDATFDNLLVANLMASH
jgi:hypothetical protein